MSNLAQRAITGTLFVLLLTGCIYWSFYSFTILFLIITCVGLLEFYTLIEHTGARPQRLLGTLAGALMFITFALAAMFEDKRILTLNLATTFGLMIAEMYNPSEKPFTNIAFTILGLIYVALPFSLWNLLVWDITAIRGFGDETVHVVTPYTPWILMGYFFLVWTNDTGAYITGRLIGRHKLFERVSPKKTWEGFFGGLLLTVSISGLISLYYRELTVTDWTIIALIISITGTLGDLVESMLKRSIAMKDSGSILPGHGGILDRFDGVLMSTPFVFTYLFIAKM